MPRPKRADEAGGIYHALNRRNAQSVIFKKEADYDAFERIVADGLERYPCRILSYQLMSNHWHFVLQPTEDGGMSDFLRWVTLTHTQRYHAHYGTSGQGHVYQGRFKSFPIQDDSHFYVVCRYVEGPYFVHIGTHHHGVDAEVVEMRAVREDESIGILSGSDTILKNFADAVPNTMRSVPRRIRPTWRLHGKIPLVLAGENVEQLSAQHLPDEAFIMRLRLEVFTTWRPLAFAANGFAAFIGISGSTGCGDSSGKAERFGGGEGEGTHRVGAQRNLPGAVALFQSGFDGVAEVVGVDVSYVRAAD